MKRSIIVLLIIILISTGLQSEAPPNFGEYWKSLSSNDRVAFLSGYNEGYQKCFFEVFL